MRITRGISSPTSVPTINTMPYSRNRKAPGVYALARNSVAGKAPPISATSNSMRKKCAGSCRSKYRDSHEPTPMANRYVPMMVENCSTESPSTYDASAPAASSYSRPQAATTNTLMSRAISMGRGPAGAPGEAGRIARQVPARRRGARRFRQGASVNGRRHDDADPQAHRRHHHGQGLVLFLDDLAPQVVGRDLVHDDKTQPENDHANQRVQHGPEEGCGPEPFDSHHGVNSLKRWCGGGGGVVKTGLMDLSAGRRLGAPAYLWLPPDEYPPNEPPELRKPLPDDPEQLLRMISRMMMMIAIRRMGAQPRPDLAVKGPGSSRCSTSALSSSLKALATVSLASLSPADQVTSFGVCSSDSRPLALAKSRLLVFWPRVTCQ